jgi:hypothetical protein
MRPVTRRRERERKSQRDSVREGRTWKRREGDRGSADSEAAGKTEGCRRQAESPILRMCLESIGPAEDTLSDCFIGSNQDLVHRLAITSSPAGLES